MSEDRRPRADGDPVTAAIAEGANRLGRALPRGFFRRDSLEVAPDLLGRVLVSGTGSDRVGVRITEVEAYRGTEDPASHAYRGPTRRNQVMFGPPGHLYLYLIYGMHWCANIVTGVDGVASAVLLRAGQVVAGERLAAARRPAARRPELLARGPAGLATVLGWGPDSYGADLCAGPALSVRAGTPAAAISSGPRVGIRVGTEHHWRFWTTGDPSVTDFRAGKLRRPRMAG